MLWLKTMQGTLKKPFYLLLELNLFSVWHHIRLPIEREVATQKESSVLITRVKEYCAELIVIPEGTTQLSIAHIIWVLGISRALCDISCSISLLHMQRQTNIHVISCKAFGFSAISNEKIF